MTPPAAATRYGSHAWQAIPQSDFNAGMYRDVARHAIPVNGVYNSVDYLLRPGVAQKRGGTSYAGPAMTGATYAQAVAYATFGSSGAKVVAMGDGSSPHLFTVASGTTTDIGAMTSFPGTLEKPKLFWTGPSNILVFTPYNGSSVPWYWDGELPPAAFQGASTGLTLTITGTPTGGSFKLQVTFTDPNNLNFPASYRTASIAYNASAADVVSAINTAIAATGVTFASGGGGSLPGTPVTLTKPNTNWAVSYLPPSISGVTLTGGTNPTGAITTTGTAADVPFGRVCEPHLERMVIANSAENQNRLWFSPELDITGQAWDLAASWFDFPDTISGLASLQDALIVFSTRGMWRLIGTVPPSSDGPDTDMYVQHIGRIGCTDPRSIVVSGSEVYFANPHGVYVTSGVAPVPLMEGRIESYWQGLFSGYDPSFSVGEGWTISAGLYGKRYLFVTVLNSSGAFVDCLMCDLSTLTWGRHTNMRARMWSSAYGVSEELYFASRATNRVVAVSGCFTPASGNKNDADGTAVAPVLETRAMGAASQSAQFGRGHLNFSMPSSDSATMAVTRAYGMNISPASYTAVGESPLAATSGGPVRKRITVNNGSNVAQAVSIKLTQSGASSATEIYGIEIERRGDVPNLENQ